MANMSARSLSIEKDVIEYGAIGGFAKQDNTAKYDNEKCIMVHLGFQIKCKIYTNLCII